MIQIYKWTQFTALLLIVLITFNGDVISAAEDKVSGNLTINDKAVKINHVYTDKGQNDIMIVFTDVSVPQDSIPFGVAGLAMEGKVQGMVLTINPESKEIDKQGYNVLYHNIWEGQLGTIGNGVLTIDRLDDEIIEGSIKTPEPNNYIEILEEKTHTYTYDIKFRSSLVQREL